MDLKTLKLNCLTLGELYNEPISKKLVIYYFTCHLLFTLMSFQT